MRDDEKESYKQNPLVAKVVEVIDKPTQPPFVFDDTLFNFHDEDLLLYTQLLLRAAYEGSYLAAIKSGSKRLVLTLVGGGSFSNPIMLILDAIAHAHATWAGHPQSCLEEVILPIYPTKGIVQGYDVPQELQKRMANAHIQHFP